MPGREAPHEKPPPRDLSPEARARYAGEWRDVQARFVREPREALRQADGLIARVMDDRGYPPLGDRIGNGAPAGAHGRTDAEGERQAMVHYGSVFQELLGSKDRAAS